MKSSKPTRLQTIDGETLLSLPLQPMNFVVDTLISQGLHILAGSPKVGKSWLALWLALTVAKGEPVWGMPVKQGSTLTSALKIPSSVSKTGCWTSPRMHRPRFTFALKPLFWDVGWKRS